MDRLEAMSMLITVTEQGSLSAAARALQVPLPTLSRKISDLESLVGARLLIRTTRRLALTDAGIAYVVAVRRILEQVEAAEHEAAGEYIAPKGELVLTAPVLFGRLHVLPVVADFLASFAEISIRLLFADRNVDLIGDHVDMAVRIGKLPDSSMVATQIGVMRTVTCASPALLATHGMPKKPQDLRRLPGVTVEAPVSTSEWHFARARSGPVDVPVQSRLTVTTTEAAVQAAIRSVGVVRLLHYQVAEALDRGELQVVLKTYEPEPAPVHLVHASRGQMPLKLRSFIDFAAPRLRQAILSMHVARR